MNFLKPSLESCSSLMWYDLCFSRSEQNLHLNLSLFPAWKRRQLTHIRFVFERVTATSASAMEMGGPLAEKGTIRGAAFFGGSVSLETLLDDGRIFSVVVGVHLNIRRRYVNFITTFLDAVVVRLFFIVGTIGVPIGTIVERTVPHETVLKRFVALLVPLEVSDHFFFLDKHAGIAVETVKMLPETNEIIKRPTLLLLFSLFKANHQNQAKNIKTTFRSVINRKKLIQKNFWWWWWWFSDITQFWWELSIF